MKTNQRSSGLPEIIQLDIEFLIGFIVMILILKAVIL